MSDTHALPDRYDRAAPAWGDKMRTLGYRDGYLGFLATMAPGPAATVIDAGCGTGAMAEAWATVAGVPERMILLDPSARMLDRAASALAPMGVAAERVQGDLTARPGPADAVLAAHVIEHCPDPVAALTDLRAMLRPGGRLYLVLSRPHWCNAIIWLQWRHRTFGRREARDLLERSGFAVETDYAFPVGPPSRTSRGWVARAV